MVVSSAYVWAGISDMFKRSVERNSLLDSSVLGWASAEFYECFTAIDVVGRPSLVWKGKNQDVLQNYSRLTKSSSLTGLNRIDEWNWIALPTLSL